MKKRIQNLAGKHTLAKITSDQEVYQIKFTTCWIERHSIVLFKSSDNVSHNVPDFESVAPIFIVFIAVVAFVYQINGLIAGNTGESPGVHKLSKNIIKV